jgi:DHA2 family multidrug resistance protein
MLVETGIRRTLIVVGLMLAVLLEIADTTIVNVALPTIQGSIGADFDQASWIVTGYLIAVIIALPLVPWLESVFGRRRYLVGAILGFTGASMLCGVADSIEALVVFRIIQGAFGGGILTSARSVLRDIFPPAQIARGQGLLAIGAVVGPSLGPTLGGILTDGFSWRWCFFINVIPGILAAVLLFVLLRDPPKTRIAFDPVGLALLVLTLGPLQYALEEGERNDWLNDPGIATCLITFAGALIAFVVWETRIAREPIVDLRILRRPAVRTGSVLSFATGFTLFVGIILSPQFSQGILGFTATLSGNLVLVRAMSIMLFVPVAIIGLTKLHLRPSRLIATGFILVAWSGFLMSGATTSGSEFWTFGWALAVGGFGFGLIFVPLSATVLSTVKGTDISKASSMLSLWQQLGASFATAILVTVLDHREAFHHAILAEDARLDRIPVAAFLQHGGALTGIARLVNQQASTLAFADANLIGAWLAGGAAVIAFFFARRPQTSPASPAPLQTTRSSSERLAALHLAPEPELEATTR